MITAYAVGDPVNLNAVRINIVNHGAAQTEILRIVGDENRVHHYSWQPLEPATDAEPTLIVPDDIGRALYEALANRYREPRNNRAEDASTLRRDYDAERARVDKLIDALIGMGQQLVTPEPSPVTSLLTRVREAP